MEAIGTFFGWIKLFLTWPLDYLTTDGGIDWTMFIVSAFIVFVVSAVVLLVIGRFILWVVDQVWRYRNRQHCQHEECDHAWTLAVSTKATARCRLDEPCCGRCQGRHAIEALHERASSEPKLICPDDLDHGYMAKEVNEEVGVIIDHCTSCGAVYLNGDEMQQLLNYAREEGYDDGYSDGKSSGTTTGLALGVAIGAGS